MVSWHSSSGVAAASSLIIFSQLQLLGKGKELDSMAVVREYSKPVQGASRSGCYHPQNSFQDRITRKSEQLTPLQRRSTDIVAVVPWYCGMLAVL